MTLPRLPALPVLLIALLAVLTLLAPARALAEPADIQAAARGVVRVVVIERDGEAVSPVSHGTGFAVAPERVVTNAHVVRQALDDPSLVLGIVPSDGENAVYARVVAISNRNDLAILATTAPLHLPPLTIAGNPVEGAGAVVAVGYPMNVDRAQGLSISDIFRAQPPVTSTGFLSGRRPSRDFDSLLHTAPIARGNSGGPLLDDCGRVIGVNSFGAESGNADAEFFFAVSTRELLPFLRANGVTAQVNGLPCRSMAELDAAEREEAEREQIAARSRRQEDAADRARRAEQARRSATFAVLEERDNGMALAGLLLVVALGAGGLAIALLDRPRRLGAMAAGAVASLALLGAGAAWMLRPGFDRIEGRVEDSLLRRTATGRPGAEVAAGGALVCLLDPQRSRVTGAPAEDLPLHWGEDGCVNGRTQYALSDGEWSRILVPSDEAAVSVNSFDPQTGEYRVERYLLGSEAMARARSARADYQAPACGAGPDAARALGISQQAVRATLPASPNERLVYRCTKAP